MPKYQRTARGGLFTNWITFLENNRQQFCAQKMKTITFLLDSRWILLLMHEKGTVEMATNTFSNCQAWQLEKKRIGTGVPSLEKAGKRNKDIFETDDSGTWIQMKQTGTQCGKGKNANSQLTGERWHKKASIWDWDSQWHWKLRAMSSRGDRSWTLTMNCSEVDNARGAIDWAVKGKGNHRTTVAERLIGWPCQWLVRWG